MSRRPSALPYVLPARDPHVTAHRWLWTALRAAILDGHLRRGTRLPSTREFASQYGLARGTVVSAFEQLHAEGYLEGHIGSGTYVSSRLPEDLLPGNLPEVRRQASEPTSRSPAGVRRLAALSSRLRGFAIDDTGPAHAFRANQPAVDLFPTDTWAQIAARRFRRLSAGQLTGCHVLGYPPLRDAIAAYLNTSRGVNCAPDQIAIVSGVQEALDLIGRLALNAGDAAAVEDPGYPGAVSVFEALGARVSALAVDAEGAMRPHDRRHPMKLIYVTPAHQFPLGVTMSLARRLELLEWARASDALIVEDDYDSEYRYHGRPVPALQGLDRHGVVVFIGSFSKVLFPALRLGYIVMPPDLVDPLTSLKSIINRHAPVLAQLVLCDFVAGGDFGRHVRRMREVYATRLGVLSEHVHRELRGWVTLSDIEAGLQTTGQLRSGFDGEAVARAAADRNVELTPLSRYARRAPSRQGLLFGFAALDEREIKRGVRDLASTLEHLARRGAPGPTGMPR